MIPNGTALLFMLVLFIGLPLVAIIMNGLSMRRHRTNHLCALSVIVTCLAIIVHTQAVLGIHTTHIPLKVVRSLEYVAAGLMILSTLLAVAGLIRRLFRRRHTRGKWRAVIAIMLNATFLTFFFINLVAGQEQDVAWRKLLQTDTPAGEVVKNEAWNFSLQPPPEWNHVNEAALGVDIRAAIGRSHPELYSVVRANDFPEGVEPSLAAAMAYIKQTLHPGGKIEFLKEEEHEGQDFNSRTMEVRTVDRSGSLFHVHWIMRDGNTLYHIHTWGDDNHTSLIRDEAKKIAEGFHLIESKHKPPKPPVAML